MPWTRDPLLKRRQQQAELLGLARTYAEELARRIELIGVIVAGSVARGDFNVWSDVDVVVMSDALPVRGLDRLELLNLGRPGRVEPHGYTQQEFARAARGGDALAREAVERGIVVHGARPGEGPVLADG